MSELERQAQLRAVFERQLTGRLARLLVQQTSETARRVAEGQSVDVALRALDERSDDMRTLIEAHAQRVALAFAHHTWDAFKHEGGKATPDDPFTKALLDVFDIQRKDRESQFLRARDDFAEQYAADEVVQINETTRDKIRRIVKKSLEEQLGVRQIARRIVEHVNGINNFSAKGRAEMISRTETHNASTFGSDQAARATGLKYTREWLSAEDSRVRPAHAAAHGQIRGPDESFNVGGYTMDRPGSGPASQVINCRCVLAYHPAAFVRTDGR